jgi:hypothetical protein
MSGDDATQDLGLMANRFKETVKTVAKKTALNSRNLAKISWSLDATWHQTLNPKTSSKSSV